MNQEEITTFIIKELAKSRNPKDVVLSVCEKTNMPWPEAEKLVRHVQLNHGKQVATRKSPLLIIFSVALLIIGAGAIFFGITTLGQGGGNRSSFRVLFLGVGLVVGGIIGLWNTIGSLLN